MSGQRSPAPRAWRWFLGVGALSAAVFLLSSNAWVQAAAQITVYALSGLLLVLRWWRGRRTRRDPLLALATVGFGIYFSASIAGSVLPQLALSTSEVPAPSVLDIGFLLSYLLLGLFLWRLGSRSAGAGRRDVLDMLIVMGGLAPVFWAFLIAPLFDGDTPLPELLTFLAYPVLVFGLVCLTVRLAFLARRRTLLHLLLAGWIVGELTADVVFLLVTVNERYVYGQSWQVLWIASATCIGVLALHPRSSVLFARSTVRQVNGARRLWVLAGCLATPIATMVYVEAITDHDVEVLVAAVASFFLVFLLCLRLSGLMVDNAEQLRVQERLQRLSEDLVHQAKHDPLTALGNRVLFAERAEDALDFRTLDPRQGPAVLLLDLDDFKTVNDTFGHDAGDRVLVEVAQRLRSVAREGEEVFRLGGDEFAFLLPQTRLQDALQLASRIGAVLAEPFDLGPRMVRPMACMGVSIALDGQSRSKLLAEADLAMYVGKSRGPGVPCVFDAALHRATLERHQLERDLRDAVPNQQLRVLYQPLVQLGSCDIVGVEALLRWEHPTRGIVAPVDFIPLAEANGAILDIGDWVLGESLRQLVAWDAAVVGSPLKMSVNVSPRQLADPDYVVRTALALRRSGLAAARVTLEITEAAFGADAATLVERIHELKRLGVSVAIDDFGTEYSSLSKLRQIPVDILKIDKSFIDGIATDPAERAFTSAIVNLAASLDKRTVAEGIETEGQRSELLRLGVELGQGYLFSRPVPPEEIEALLRARPTDRRVSMTRGRPLSGVWDPAGARHDVPQPRMPEQPASIGPGPS